jgi:hypothetical protein
VLRAIFLTLLFLVLVTWSSSANAAQLPSTSAGAVANTDLENQTEWTDGTAATEDDADCESLEMSIPLEDDGVIDIDAPEMGVKIEQWAGDEVLVIVERRKRSKTLAGSEPVEPFNILVTREGKNVRIETSGGAGWWQCGMDLSFRIVLPDNYDGRRMARETDGLDRVTGILWKAVHRGALKWMTR